MNDQFEGSFKIYMEPEYHQPNLGSGRRGYGDEPCNMDTFSMEVENVKGDLLNLEEMYNRLHESNEEIKEAQNATTMRELRARLHADLDHIIKLAKQINKKYDGLVRVNAAHRKLGSTDDHVRASMISQLTESLQFLMRKFQGIKVHMESDHRQLIETKYYTITREKATAEAIDNLMASEVPEGPLQLAMQEFGRGPVMDAVAEIQERRDTMREVRRSLMSLHQVFLSIATPVTAAVAAEGNKGRLASPAVRLASPAVLTTPGPGPMAGAFSALIKGGKGNGGGAGGLNDYERETRKQSYFALGLTLVIMAVLIVMALRVDNELERRPNL